MNISTTSCTKSSTHQPDTMEKVHRSTQEKTMFLLKNEQFRVIKIIVFVP